MSRHDRLLYVRNLRTPEKPASCLFHRLQRSCQIRLRSCQTPPRSCQMNARSCQNSTKCGLTPMNKVKWHDVTTSSRQLKGCGNLSSVVRFLVVAWPRCAFVSPWRIFGCGSASAFAPFVVNLRSLCLSPGNQFCCGARRVRLVRQWSTAIMALTQTAATRYPAITSVG